MEGRRGAEMWAVVAVGERELRTVPVTAVKLQNLGPHLYKKRKEGERDRKEGGDEGSRKEEGEAGEEGRKKKKQRHKGVRN